MANQLGLLKYGVVVHQGKPQVISRTPTDPFIANPIGDIKRARVLKVRSSCPEKIALSPDDKLVFLQRYRPQGQFCAAIKIKCVLGLRNKRLLGSTEAYSIVLL